MLDFEQIFDKSSPGVVAASYSRDAVLPKPFAFVADPLSLEGQRVIELAPGYKLRVSDKEEIKFIKKTIKELFGQHFGGGIWETQRPKSGKGAYKELQERHWRYFSIEFEGESEDWRTLERALSLSKSDLQIAFVLSTVQYDDLVLPTCVYRPPSLFQSLSYLSSGSHTSEGCVKSISPADGEDISSIFLALKSYDHKIVDLQSAFKLLFELKDLPHFSPLQILGYFAILESILTHQPNPEDRYDSITRQITNKIALLNRRWHTSLNYKNFGDVSHDKLWSKMYSYRSAIAHGAKPDFSSKLSLLNNAKSANGLIKAAVVGSIRHCLIEPQLLADLHNC